MTAPLHTIRLGPPWEVTVTPGGTRHARRFGSPRTLDPAERLWLVCAHVPGPAEVQVNGTLVAEVVAPGPVAVDLTSLLRARNEVVFIVRSASALGAVALEVRAAGSPA